MADADATPEPWLICSPNAPDAEAIRFDPAWRTSTVVALAAGIVQDGNFDVLPILADALQDAGCDNTTLLEHCRHGTEHTEDCWALEVVTSFYLPAIDPPRQRPPTSRPILIEAAQMVDALGERNVGILLPVGLLWGLVLVMLHKLNGIYDVLDEPTGGLVTLVFILVGGLCLFVLYLVYCVKLVRNRRRRRRAIR